MVNKVFIEGYGCSANKGDTEQLKSLFKGRGFSFSKENEADLLVINTCAVKEPTEFKMLRRIKELMEKKKKNAKLIAFGCLPKINPEKINEIEKEYGEEILQCGPSLEGLTNALEEFENKISFRPCSEDVKENEFISIISICRGCLSNCSYCATKKARGNLRSYSIKEINECFSQAIYEKEVKEVWITGQDIGCYGFDLETNLVELLEKLLENEGMYRIRLGMMNIMHLKKYYKELIELMKRDERIYRFLHLPLQSGSDKILKGMKRAYTKEEFLELVNKFKKELPLITISTDIIVGFPEETEEDFQETVLALKEFRPSVINISMYGKRPGTEAAEMKQLPGFVKKERSRILTKLAREFSLEGNKQFEGREEEILVTEKGRTGNFIGRNLSYKPVIIKSDERGKFVRKRIKKARAKFLE